MQKINTIYATNQSLLWDLNSPYLATWDYVQISLSRLNSPKLALSRTNSP